MARRRTFDAWARMFQRSLTAITGSVLRESGRQVTRALKPSRVRSPNLRPLTQGSGDWIPGVALGPTGARRFRLYRPSDVKFGERLPLMVMLHGCGQTADSFAASTRMNRIASRERFLVLYPEQDRLANAQGCWNWFDTKSGRAHGEAALILRAIDQVCLLHPVDRGRVALVGLSAGASMASLLAFGCSARAGALGHLGAGCDAWTPHPGAAEGDAAGPVRDVAAAAGHPRRGRSGGFA